MAAITKELFGKTKKGQEVYSFTLKAGDITVRAINIGCCIKDILVPDKDGNIADVNTGYADCAKGHVFLLETYDDETTEYCDPITVLYTDGYEDNPGYLGCNCGRVANRIDRGKFTIDDTEYSVSLNDPLGDNMCHGGFEGFAGRYWDWEIAGSKLKLTYVDPDGCEGFPGDVTTTVTYELTEENGLMMDYVATTTKATPIDQSNHFLTNLAGHGVGNVRNHVITLNADQVLEYNDRLIPTGNIIDVAETGFDLRKPTLLDNALKAVAREDGFLHGFLLPGKLGEKKFVGRADHPESGRYMEVSSTEACVVFYTGYYLDFLLKDKAGITIKDDAQYAREGALVFMPQGYPNAVNTETFPNCVVRPGETYHTTSWYKFGVKK